jgi:hypothetical protein
MMDAATRKLVDQKRERRRGERGGGSELPLAAAAGPGKQPECERGDGDRRHGPSLEHAESASEPGVVLDELVDCVVDAVVHDVSLRRDGNRAVRGRSLPRPKAMMVDRFEDAGESGDRLPP